MRTRRIAVSLAIAVLSFGFVGHSPSGEGTRRHVSSACGDATQPSAPSSSLPAFPRGLFSFVQDDAVRQAAEAYALFQRQLQVNAAIGPNPFAGASVFGFPMPLFPGYDVASIKDYPVSLVKPDTSHLMWSGLGANPQLQFLVHPAAAPAATSVASGSLNGYIDLAPLPATTGAALGSTTRLNAARF